MATPGKPLDDATRRALERLRADAGRSVRETARELGLSKTTVQKYSRDTPSKVVQS